MVYSPARSSDLFFILDCMSSNFLHLSFSTLDSSGLWRTDTIIFTKLSKPPSPPPQRIYGIIKRGSKDAFHWDDPNKDQRSKITPIITQQRNQRNHPGKGFKGSFDVP